MRLVLCQLPGSALLADGPLTGVIRLSQVGGGWDQVPDADADRIVVPYAINFTAPLDAEPAMRQFLSRLPHFAEDPCRHVLVDTSDPDSPYNCLRGALLCRVSASYRDPAAVALPYHVRAPASVPDITEAEFDLGFHGSLKTHPLRQALDKWHRTWRELKIDFVATPA